MLSSLPNRRQLRKTTATVHQVVKPQSVSTIKAVAPTALPSTSMEVSEELIQASTATPSHHKRSRSEESLEEVPLPKTRSSIPSGGSRRPPPVSTSAVTSAPVSVSAVTPTPVSALAVTTSPVSALAVTPTPVSAPAVTPTSVSASAVTPAPVSTSAVTPAPVSATAVTPTLVSAPAVTPSPMSAHAVITAPAASLTKPVATSLATGLGKTARRLSTASTALPTTIRQGKSKKDAGVGKASSRGLPMHR